MPQTHRELNRTLIGRFDTWLLVQHYSEQTRTRYHAIAKRFASFLGRRLLTTTTHSDVQEHLGRCARANFTVHILNIELLGLRSLFDFLSLGGLMKWVPPRLVSLRYAGPRLPRYLPTQDVKKLFRAAKNLRERFVLEMLYGTGCRSCELSGMRIEDIDFAEHRVRVPTKHKPFRTLMLPPRVIKTLRRYIGNRKSGYVLADGRPLQKLSPQQAEDGSWYTFYRTYDEKGRRTGLVRQYISSRQCRLTLRQAQMEFLRRAQDQRHQRPLGLVPISIYGIHLLVHRIGIRAGIRVYPQMLRHSLATHLMDNGGDLRLVADCLGHSSVKSTMSYLHLSRKAAQENFERLNPLNFLGGTHGGNVLKKEARPSASH